MCLAIPGKIESITGDDPLSRMGKINFGGILKEACLAYVPEGEGRRLRHRACRVRP